MTMDSNELLGKLKTRGFETGFQRTPLREFIGRLDSITSAMVERFQPPRLEVLYNFSELEVIQSTEPYQFPIAQISLMHSNRDKSVMGYFGASVDRVVNAEFYDKDGKPVDPPAGQLVKGQGYLIGKVLHMKLTPGHPIWDKESGLEKPRECWELTEIVGEASPTKAQAGTAPASGGVITPVQRALQILDGKTLQQFNNEVFKDSVCKADADLVGSIINNQFIPPLESTGMVTKDADGVFHVKKD